MYNKFLEMNREEFRSMVMELTLKNIGEIAEEYNLTVNTKTKKTTAVDQLIAQFEKLQENSQENSQETSSFDDTQAREDIIAMQNKLSGIGVKVLNIVNFGFGENVSITEEENYEVIYNIDSREFTLATTKSNQILNEEYIKLLMKIMNIINGHELVSKYGVGTTHMTAKGEIEITKVFTENEVEMIEYRIGSEYKVNKKVNVVSNIHKYLKKASK